MAATTHFRFIDLFAGIGGFRFALESLGGENVLTVERDRFARQTYAAWHGEDLESHSFVGDIEQLDVADVPEHDVLAAGFPCQPFSLAGVSKKNSLGRAHGFADPTQGTLFFNIKEIAAERRPSVLILENVKNLKSHDRHRTWQQSMKHCGASISPHTIASTMHATGCPSIVSASLSSHSTMKSCHPWPTSCSLIPRHTRIH